MYVTGSVKTLHVHMHILIHFRTLMLFTYLPNWSLGVVMISIATHNLLIVVGFGKCTGPRLLVVILQNFEILWPKGQLILLII